ncbi:hypothetical protein OHJ16_15485, partial [Actinomyces israelii]
PVGSSNSPSTHAYQHDHARERDRTRPHNHAIMPDNHHRQPLRPFPVPVRTCGIHHRPRPVRRT